MSQLKGMDALALLELIDAYRELGHSHERISEILNEAGVEPPEGQRWTARMVADYDELAGTDPVRKPGLKRDPGKNRRSNTG